MTGKSDLLVRRLLVSGAMLAMLQNAASAQQAAPFAAEAGDAEDEIRRYAVELIVFEYGAGASGTKESFLPDTVEEEFLADPYGNPDADYGIDDDASDF